MNSTMLILIYVAVALVVSRIPFLRVYISLCYTLLYEVICVLFLKGSIRHKIKLQNDGSWQATNNTHSYFKKALIAYVGYTATSFIAIGLFYLVSRGQYPIIIYFFIALLVISLFLWIRSFFGFIWALSFVSILALPIYFRFEVGDYAYWYFSGIRHSDTIGFDCFPIMQAKLAAAEKSRSG